MEGTLRRGMSRLCRCLLLRAWYWSAQWTHFYLFISSMAAAAKHYDFVSWDNLDDLFSEEEGGVIVSVSLK